MKKLMAVMLAIAIVVLPVLSMAENNISKYKTLLTGKWKCVSQNTQAYSYELSGLPYFIFPGTNSVPYRDETRYLTTELVGDETGEVYLIINIYPYIVGRVLLSEDNNTLVLLSSDGAIFVFQRE